MKPELDITPESKVGELLDSYPQLEEVLVELSPAFEKLRNPVLRKTVAKVASLRQISKIGNIPVAELISRLRQEVGQEPTTLTADDTDSASAKPDWVSQADIGGTLDARRRRRPFLCPPAANG